MKLRDIEEFEDVLMGLANTMTIERLSGKTVRWPLYRLVILVDP